jgi:hypothetical protein
MATPIDDFYAVIPAGGVGSRLWPLSRADAPKFLHDLTGSGHSLLRDTWDRLEPLSGADRIAVVTGRAHRAAVEDQLPGQIVGHGGVCIAGKAAEQLDAGLHQRHLRPGADAAAEQDVCAMLYEKARQCAVALTIRRDDLGAQELAVFGLIELELCGAAKVLEHLTVFERDCDFHENVSFTAGFVQPPGCSLPAFWRPEA